MEVEFFCVYIHKRSVVIQEFRDLNGNTICIRQRVSINLEKLYCLQILSITHIHTHTHLFICLFYLIMVKKYTLGKRGIFHRLTTIHIKFNNSGSGQLLYVCQMTVSNKPKKIGQILKL